MSELNLRAEMQSAENYINKINRKTAPTTGEITTVIQACEFLMSNGNEAMHTKYSEMRDRIKYANS